MPAEVGARPDGTIVVATKDRSHRLDSTLGHLVRDTTWPVVVVDDASSDDTCSVAIRRAQLHPSEPLQVIRLERSLGAAARNVGVRAARTPLVAFADDDSWWAPGTLEAAVRHFEAHPELAVVCATVLIGDEERVDPIVEDQLRSPLGRSAVGPRILGFLACSIVVRRSAYLEAGGFDELLGIGGEEELLAIELRRRGWDLALDPHLVAHHHPEPRGADARRAGEVRRIGNRLLVAWMRRPLRLAVTQTLRLAAAAATDATARSAMAVWWRGLRGALARREVVPGWLETELRTLERSEPLRPVR